MDVLREQFGGKRGRGRKSKLVGGNWQDDIRNAFDPNKNGFNASIADTKAKFEDFGQKAKHEFEDRDSLLRGTILPTATAALSAVPGMEGVAMAVDAANSLGGSRIVRPRPTDEERLARARAQAAADHQARIAQAVARIQQADQAERQGERWMDMMRDRQAAADVPHQTDGAGRFGTRGEVVQTRTVTGRVVHKRRPLREDDARKRRAVLVGQLMKEHGLTLAQASKHIKEHGLSW